MYRLASALKKMGVGRLDTVAIIASNIPEMIEAHYAIPMLAQYLIHSILGLTPPLSRFR
jgi:fatty-acyl-CoA synthase